jgi:hypothetical protein
LFGKVSGRSRAAQLDKRRSWRPDDQERRLPRRRRRRGIAARSTPATKPQGADPPRTVRRDLSAESLAGPLAARPNGFRR